MHVLVLENYHGTPLGQVATAMDEAGIEYSSARLYDGEALPVGESFDGLVILGGGQNAMDDANHPWFAQTLDLIRSYTAQERPVLGICLGSQLIARAFGGENRIGGHYEFGWHSVELTDDAADDPVFGSVPASFPIFQWHDDHFSLPPGAVRLAGSDVAENQAFRVGRATYATQFHFEADRAQVELWSETFRNLLDAREPDWAQRHPREAALHGPSADAIGLTIARGWVGMLSRCP